MVKRCIDITCVKIATSVGSTSEQYLVDPAPVPGSGCWAQAELGRLRAELVRAQGSAGAGLRVGTRAQGGHKGSGALQVGSF